MVRHNHKAIKRYLRLYGGSDDSISIKPTKQLYSWNDVLNSAIRGQFTNPSSVLRSIVLPAIGAVLMVAALAIPGVGEVVDGAVIAAEVGEAAAAAEVVAEAATVGSELGNAIATASNIVSDISAINGMATAIQDGADPTQVALASLAIAARFAALGQVAGDLKAAAAAGSVTASRLNMAAKAIQYADTYGSKVIEYGPRIKPGMSAVHNKLTNFLYSENPDPPKTTIDSYVQLAKSMPEFDSRSGYLFGGILEQRDPDGGPSDYGLRYVSYLPQLSVNMEITWVNGENKNTESRLRDKVVPYGPLSLLSWKNAEYYLEPVDSLFEPVKYDKNWIPVYVDACKQLNEYAYDLFSKVDSKQAILDIYKSNPNITSTPKSTQVQSAESAAAAAYVKANTIMPTQQVVNMKGATDLSKLTPSQITDYIMSKYPDVSDIDPMVLNKEQFAAFDAALKAAPDAKAASDAAAKATSDAAAYKAATTKIADTEAQKQALLLALQKDPTNKDLLAQYNALQTYYVNPAYAPPPKSENYVPPVDPNAIQFETPVDNSMLEPPMGGRKRRGKRGGLGPFPQTIDPDNLPFGNLDATRKTSTSDPVGVPKSVGFPTGFNPSPISIKTSYPIPLGALTPLESGVARGLNVMGAITDGPLYRYGTPYSYITLDLMPCLTPYNIYYALYPDKVDVINAVPTTLSDPDSDFATTILTIGSLWSPPSNADLSIAVRANGVLGYNFMTQAGMFQVLSYNAEDYLNSDQEKENSTKLVNIGVNIWSLTQRLTVAQKMGNNAYANDKLLGSVLTLDQAGMLATGKTSGQYDELCDKRDRLAATAADDDLKYALEVKDLTAQLAILVEKFDAAVMTWKNDWVKYMSNIYNGYVMRGMILNGEKTYANFQIPQFPFSKVRDITAEEKKMNVFGDQVMSVKDMQNNGKFQIPLTTKSTTISIPGGYSVVIPVGSNKLQGLYASKLVFEDPPTIPLSADKTEWDTLVSTQKAKIDILFKTLTGFENPDGPTTSPNFLGKYSLDAFLDWYTYEKSHGTFFNKIPTVSENNLPIQPIDALRSIIGIDDIATGLKMVQKAAADAFSAWNSTKGKFPPAIFRTPETGSVEYNNIKLDDMKSWIEYYKMYPGIITGPGMNTNPNDDPMVPKSLPTVPYTGSVAQQSLTGGFATRKHRGTPAYMLTHYRMRNRL